jgi:phospholipase/carboxylesterase
MDFSSFEKILPQDKPKKAVVFLHGYGANGKDLLSVGQIWRNELGSVAFIAPNAPHPFEMNPNFGFQWFGIQDFSPLNVRKGIDFARPKLLKILDNILLNLNLEPKDMFLVGFSQGTIMALEMLYVMDNLAGIIGYSGAFYPKKDQGVLSIDTKILLVHGTADNVVPYPAMNYAYSELKKLDMDVKTYTCQNLAHSINQAGILQGLDFVKKLI